MSLLQTVDMGVAFGGLKAVNEVSIDVEPGTLVGLIGPNGAGKTTFIDGITGFVPTTGHVRFDGREISKLPAHARALAGLGRSWQSLELFDDLTVRENLMVAAERQSAKLFLLDMIRPNRARDMSAVTGAMELLDIADLADRMPNEISQGQRKLVSVARALAGRPKLVAMDEPAAGLDSTESLALGARLRDIVDDGTAIFLVDHDMGLILKVCDYIYVIEFGQMIAKGTPSEIRNNDRVIEAYLGSQGRQDKEAAALPAEHPEEAHEYVHDESNPIEFEPRIEGDL